MSTVSLAEALEFHDEYRREARRLYEDSLNPVDCGADWREALTEARKIILDALRHSNCLHDVAAALQQSGRHMLVFRHLMAPPVSQDQFKLICNAWPKGSEKSGAGVDPERASAVAVSFTLWKSPRLTPWMQASRPPILREIYSLLLAIAPLIAAQRVATARRNRLARVQEEGLMTRLESRGWHKVPTRTIDRQGELQSHEFMHKARFASGPTGRAEVDIALGISDAVVLAMECKVTNDETNSVKRVNDVLKKAEAWKRHWGNFVQPAALLQGVIKLGDVKRLLDAGVSVFWSHRLDLFEAWLVEKTTN